MKHKQCVRCKSTEVLLFEKSGLHLLLSVN